MFYFLFYVFRLHCYFPTGSYTNSIQFCQKLFKLNLELPNPYPFDYRLVFAIAAKDKILIYDTQQPYPIAEISDIHYTRLSDLSWSIDGQLLMATSTDGFCTLIYFGENELGERYEGEPYQFETVEAKKQSNVPAKKASNKAILEKKEEIISNENLSAEKAPQNKITDFFTKKPLLPTKLANSFHQIANKTTNNLDDENLKDLRLIKELNKNADRNEMSSPDEIMIIDNGMSKPANLKLFKQNEQQLNNNNVNKSLNLNKNSVASMIAVKRKPTQASNNKVSLNRNNFSQQSNNLQIKNDENLKSNNINENAISLPLKRPNIEQNTEQETKKKKVALIKLD